MTKVMIGYKIRNKETGEFSKGGASNYNIWTNRGGKTWSTKGALKNHLNQFMYRGEIGKDYPYLNAEIVEVEIKLEECFTYDVNILMGEMAMAKEEKAKKEEELYEKWKRQRELKQLEELQKKYPQFTISNK
jgi:hypothetical protein